MENNLGHVDDESGRPEAAEAREALKQLQDDGARLAARVVTPWWYHLALGVIVAAFAAFAGAQALPGTASMWIVVIGILLVNFLINTYSRRYGISAIQPTGPRSKRLFWAMLIVLAPTMASGFAIRYFALSSWWGIVPAVVAFFAIVVLGRRYDDALRDELSGQTRRAG
jgi:hypothetical protein